MLPCYYPTSIMVVDDDPLFLESFRFRLGGAFPCRIANTPESALAALQGAKGSALAASPYPLDHGLTGVELRPALAHNVAALMKSPQRFDEISTVIVDFDMPRMNGVQFCRAIANLPVRKIMLTGKADAETAIAAFNEGVIDYFIKKEAIDLDVRLERQIALLQFHYFEKLAEAGTRLLAASGYGFLTDEGLAAVFEELRQTLRCTEHFLIAEPPGLLMFDDTGTPTLLLVIDKPTLQAHREIAETQGAPRPLIEILTSCQVVPCFPTLNGYYNPRFAQSWGRYIFPVTEMAIDSPWKTAIVPKEAAAYFTPASAVSWAAHLRSRAVMLN